METTIVDGRRNITFLCANVEIVPEGDFGVTEMEEFWASNE
jgi:hypothetical protein